LSAAAPPVGYLMKPTRPCPSVFPKGDDRALTPIASGRHPGRALARRRSLAASGQPGPLPDQPHSDLQDLQERRSARPVLQPGPGPRAPYDPPMPFLIYLAVLLAAVS